MAAADGGLPDGEAGVAVAQSKRIRNSAHVSEIAKKVRLRATMVKRHAKPRVYQLKPTASNAKGKASRCCDSGEICNSVEAKAPEVTVVEPAVEKNEDMYTQAAEDDLVFGHNLGHVSQEVDNDMRKPAHVVASEEKSEDPCSEASEWDASPDVNCHATITKLGPRFLPKPLKPPKDALVEDSAKRGEADLADETTVLQDSTVAYHEDRTARLFSSKYADHSAAEGLSLSIRPVPTRHQEITYSRRNRKECLNLEKGPSRVQSRSVPVQDAAAVFYASNLDARESTIWENHLPDEDLPDFSNDEGSDGGSEHASGRCGGRIRKPILERVANPSNNEPEKYESNVREPSVGSEYLGSESTHGRNKERAFHYGPSAGRFSPGNLWHIGKRADESRLVEDIHLPGPPKARFKERHSFTLDHVQHTQEQEELPVRELPAVSFLPYGHLVPIVWRWSERADMNNESTNRMVVAKERSVFVGCIPDGLENLEELLYELMDRFLERFDFAPVNFGQIEMVKAVKDFAFIELMSDKVAQIVLAANQLDVYEWGVSGFHFNLQGCTSTCTSVRPSVENLPLRPARVLFVGNIPDERWHTKELAEFFSDLLQGPEQPIVPNYVIDVFLLPDSSDAYVEVASEIMADALIFKCSKSPELLKELGDDVFICRDTCSVPLMSRHRALLSAQCSLVVAVPPGGEELKINNVVKVFLDVLPYIARKNNQIGYMEFVLIEPGKDYAFFQFNSDDFVDAIMDEYIESTQIFLCRGTPASYIILRPPEYIRPGARYRSDSAYKGNKIQLPGLDAFGTELDRQRRSQIAAEQGNTISYVPRRFGDEPVKRPDFVTSVGTSEPPLATWNGLTSSGCASTDPDCMIIVMGLPRGLSFKLARGALNELFERLLCETGLLEAGRLTVTYLDRDGNLDVASLPNADLAYAILSVDSTFVVAGEEIRLFSYDKRSLFRRSDSADFSGGPCELSSLSDEDSPGLMMARKQDVDVRGAPGFHQRRARGFTNWEQQTFSHHESAMQGPPGRPKTNSNNSTDDQVHGDGWNGFYKSKQSYRGVCKENFQSWQGPNDRSQTWEAPNWVGNQRMRQPENLRCQGNNPRVRMSHGQKGTINYVNEAAGDEAEGPKLVGKPSSMNDRFRIINREGRRTIHQGADPHGFEGSVGMGGQFVRKRKFPSVGLGGPTHGLGFSQKMTRSSQYS